MEILINSILVLTFIELFFEITLSQKLKHKMNL